VEHLELGIAICGALGLAGMVMAGVGQMLAQDQISTAVMLAAFALPVVMAVMGLAKPPRKAWQGGVSLACYALALSKLPIWNRLERIAAMPGFWWLMMVGAGLGAILSVIAVVKPDARA
jgi:hypothetical protein